MAEAGKEAMKMVSHIIHAHPKEPAEIWEGWSIEVINEDGAPAFTLPFENVLRRKTNGSGERGQPLGLGRLARVGPCCENAD
jgi:hypothetical protein